MPVVRRLLTLSAEDGQTNDALLEIDERAARARARSTGRRTAMLHLHGIMGNFLVGTLRFYPAPIARAGYPILVLETRMGNVGQIFGQAIFDDAVLDIEAGRRFLAGEGYDNVMLSGYSSGAALAARYAASRAVPGLRGLVGLGMPWSLPGSLEGRARRWGAQPSYQEVVERARAVVRAGRDEPEADELFVIERSRGPSARPAHSEIYTYRTWWHSRGPEATAAMPHRQLDRVPAPILLVQGAADEVVHADEAERLAGVARAGGNPDVEVVTLDGCGHAFKGHEIATRDAVLRWMRDHA